MEITKLRTAYEICKALRRDPGTFKAYTDRDFARDYLECNFSMVTKVLAGKAVSKPTTDAIIRFIQDSEHLYRKARGIMDQIVKTR